MKLTSTEDFRHTCEQNEGMAGYGWDEYDIRKGGRETIHDAGNSLDLTIDFIKVPGGQHGGSWGFRVKGTPTEGADPYQPISMIFYSTLEGFGHLGTDSSSSDSTGVEGNVKLEGYSTELGDFTIDVTTGPETNSYPRYNHPSSTDKPLDRSIVASVAFPEEQLWQAKGIFFAQMKAGVDQALEEYGKENVPPPSPAFYYQSQTWPGQCSSCAESFRWCIRI